MQLIAAILLPSLVLGKVKVRVVLLDHVVEVKLVMVIISISSKKTLKRKTLKETFKMTLKKSKEASKNKSK
jgi:hypothetical protein